MLFAGVICWCSPNQIPLPTTRARRYGYGFLFWQSNTNPSFMHWLDWLIIVAYLIYIVYDGIRLTRRSQGLEGYFLANKSLPWWAVGLSVMATQLSAITLVGTTGQAYDKGMGFIQFYFGLPLAMVILCVTVVPFFYRANVFTAYEYLERRFDAKTRSLTSFLFLLSRGLSCGVIIAAPSVILSIVLGWNETITILAMGISTTLYTMFGGVQAVTWTDVKQMVIIFVGLAVVLFVIFSQLPSGVGINEALSIAGAAGKLETVSFNTSPKETYTFWSGLIGGLFLMLSYFGCDQSQVQRYLTARSVSEGRTSLLMSAFVKIPMQFVILLIGVLVFVFYQFQAPPIIFNRQDVAAVDSSSFSGEFHQLQQQYQAEAAARSTQATALANAVSNGVADLTQQRDAYLRADSAMGATRKQAIAVVKQATQNQTFSDVNHVFPTFVTTQMPPGVIGLIIAAIFAAAMSSIAAELNSLSTATVIDFYRRFYRSNASDSHYLWVSKLTTLLWGAFACVVAFYAMQLGSLIEVVNRFGSFFYGSLLGVFVLALGVKRATANGAFVGLIAGMGTITLLHYGFNPDGQMMSFLWYNVVGCVAVVGVGLAWSLVENRGKDERKQ